MMNEFKSEEEKRIEKEQFLASYDGPDRIVHITEYMKLREEEIKKWKPYSTGFPALDEKMGGILTGEVTVMTGHTGQGKTLLAESIVANMLTQINSPVCAFFSFETPVDVIGKKYAEYPNRPLYVPLSLKSMDFDWLADRIWEAKVKQEGRVFVIDHLHFLVDMATRQNMSLNIGAFMRRLKFDVAIGMNVAVILIAHQKGEEDGQDASLAGIRDSSFIAQESDNVLVVSRHKDFSSTQIDQISNPELQLKIRNRMLNFYDPNDPFHHQFASVNIAKARRIGTFRWPKLFQKCGPWLEEV